MEYFRINRLFNLSSCLRSQSRICYIWFAIEIYPLLSYDRSFSVIHILYILVSEAIMGDVAISDLVKVVLGRLNITCEDIQGYGFLCGFEQDIKAIKNQFEYIRPYVHDAEEKAASSEDAKDKASREDAIKKVNSEDAKEMADAKEKATSEDAKEKASSEDAKKKVSSSEDDVCLWLNRLRPVIEEVLNDVLYEGMLQSVYKERGVKSRVRTFLSTDHNQFMYRRRIADSVKQVKNRLLEIKSDIPKLSLTPGDMSRHVDLDVEGKMPHRKTSSTIGRDNDVKTVIENISSEDTGKHDNGELRVYGIWGMEGVGKTTLAKSAYKKKKVNTHFKLKYWVNVHKIIQVKDIMIKIIKEIDNGKCELTHIDALQSYLQRKLNGKRFLIVLDDLLIEDPVQWDLLSGTLCGGKEGGTVMITTRSKITLQMTVKVEKLQHHLQPLSKEDSWLLFKRIAFEGREVDDIRELQPIGWKIVDKCGGVPLKVNNLARLMRSKKGKNAWLNVMKNNIKGVLDPKISHEDTTVLQNDVALPDLRLSYDSLPPHVKRCFTYCYLFPKGYVIEKDVVIQLWVVNNFIPPKGIQDLYVLGEKIFNYLVQTSLFQVVKDKKYSNCRFKVHNLMHDMALELMGCDLFVVQPESVEVKIPNEVVHLSSSPRFPFPAQDLGKLTLLRSIFMFGKINDGCISQIFNQTNIRVLYLCGIGLKELPESICKLKNLEYLNLSYSSIELLPESIFYLQNLQMLLLKFCYELYKLPEGLRYMRSLRLLDITSCHSLRYLPSGIKAITKMRRLPRFHVGNNIAGAKLEELGHLKDLEGELEISGLENVGGLDSSTAKLNDKKKLSVLKLSWSNIDTRESNREMLAYDEKVLEGLKPDSSLEQLHIYFYMGENFSPAWMSGLQNLVEIGFSGCTRCKGIPPLGTLKKLKVIKLLGMNSLEGFHTDDFAKDTDIFIGLQELYIFLCPNLVFLPSKLPKLQVLKLVECGALTSIPNEILRGLKELDISGCKHLTKRYKKNGDEDQPHEISRISKIRIDSPGNILHGS